MPLSDGLSAARRIRQLENEKGVKVSVYDHLMTQCSDLAGHDTHHLSYRRCTHPSYGGLSERGHAGQ
jgi:hypothetical protein